MTETKVVDGNRILKSYWNVNVRREIWGYKSLVTKAEL